MSTISINGETRPLEQADPDWITTQIAGRRRDGQSVCVRVTVAAPGLNVAMATPGCGSGGGGGGGRAPNPAEREVLDLWEKQHLNRADFSPGQVVAFVRHLLRLI